MGESIVQSKPCPVRGKRYRSYLATLQAKSAVIR